MTTYTLDAFSADFAGGNTTSVKSGLELQIVAPDNAWFAYSVDKTFKEGLPLVSVTTGNTGLYGMTIDGYTLPYWQADAFLGTITWSGGKTTVLDLSFETGASTSTDYYIVLDGAPLPELKTVRQFDAFGSKISKFALATGDFAPDQRIKYSEIAEVSINETDEIYGTAGRDVLTGGAGDDEIYGSKGNDTLDGGAGYDEVHYSGDPAGVTVNLARKTATDGWGNTDKVLNFELVRGSLHDDTLSGNAADNAFRGLAGDDVIKGGAGSDAVGYDKDAVYGGTAGVLVNLARGKATDGFGDHDTLSSIERAYGGDAGDTLLGSGADNTLHGNGGNDTIRGARGDDTLAGDDGRDKLFGDAGNDMLHGDRASDRLVGGNGNDSLDGGAGNDTLLGGAGSDSFTFEDGFGRDVIRDFDALDDSETIDLGDVSAIRGFRDLRLNHMSRDGGDVVIDDGDGNTIRLVDMKLADLDAGDFLF